MPVLTVARLVRRETLLRPLHLALVLVSAALLLLTPALASFGFGREDDLVTVGGLETISLYAFAVCILFGAGSVGHDAESRHALSILARPVGRGQYLLGRFLGLLETCCLGAAALAMLVVVLLLVSARHAPDLARIAQLAGSVVLALCQAASLSATVLTLSLVAPRSLGLVLAVLVAAGGFLAEPLRQALPPESSPVVAGLARALSLILPPISRPGEASEVGFGGALPLGLLALGMLRALVYSAMLLAVGSWCLGRKDLT